MELKHIVAKAITDEKEKYYKSILDKTNNNIKQKWNAIRLIINHSKIQQNNCTIPNNILGEHYSTVAKNQLTNYPTRQKMIYLQHLQEEENLRIHINHILLLIKPQAGKFMNYYLSWTQTKDQELIMQM